MKKSPKIQGFRLPKTHTKAAFESLEIKRNNKTQTFAEGHAENLFITSIKLVLGNYLKSSPKRQFAQPKNEWQTPRQTLKKAQLVKKIIQSGNT